MTIITELADEVRVLELELQKLELGNRLAQLKSIDEGCIGCAGHCNVVDVAAKLQEEIDDKIKSIQGLKQVTIEQYKEIVELTMRNNSLKDQYMLDQKTIERLDAAILNFKTIETRETDRLHKTIEGLKDSNIEDLKELYDFYEEEIRRFKHIVSARDLTIKSLTTMCQSSGTERNKLTAELRSVKADYEIMRTNHYHSVAKLQGDIKGLEKERDEWRQSSLDAQHVIKREARHLIITNTERETDHAAIRTLNQHIIGLEAELSARKEDSAVLMKVVDVVNDDTISRFAVPWRIRCIVEDYLDAPGGPPETPIDDLYKVTVSYAILEVP